MGDRRNDDLRDTVALGNGEIILAQIGQNDLDFPAIIAVDCSGCVEAGDAMFQGEARPWADLHFKAVGNGKGESCRHRMALACPQRQAFRRANVHARCTGGRIIGHGKARAMVEPFYLYFNLGRAHRRPFP